MLLRAQTTCLYDLITLMSQLMRCLNYKNGLTMCRHENMPFNFDWHVKFGFYWKQFNRNVARQKLPKQAGRNLVLHVTFTAQIFCEADLLGICGGAPRKLLASKMPREKSRASGQKKTFIKVLLQSLTIASCCHYHTSITVQLSLTSKRPGRATNRSNVYFFIQVRVFNARINLYVQ